MTVFLAASAASCVALPERHADPALPSPEPLDAGAAPSRESDWASVADVLPVIDPIRFGKDKAVLTPEGMATLDLYVSELKRQPVVHGVIEGHTCDTEGGADKAGLSRRRAEAAARYVIAHGIDPARLTVETRADSEPTVPNTSESNRKLNRRVVVYGDFPFEYAGEP